MSPPKRTAAVPARRAGPGRPANVDSEDTRRRIIVGARECFATRGYAATSNRDIAERTGVTAAAVYHHFGRKVDLMHAVYRATEVESYARMQAAIDRADGLVARAEAVFDETHRTLSADRFAATYMFVAREEARRHPELADLAADSMFASLFADIVKRAVDDGEIAQRDAKHVRAVLMVLAAGLASVGTEVSTSAHRTATEGCKRLMRGELLSPPA